MRFYQTRFPRFLLFAGFVLCSQSIGIVSFAQSNSHRMKESVDISRRLVYHTRFLQAVAKSSPQIEVTENIQQVRRSLVFIAEHGNEAGSKAASAAAKIFFLTQDLETRRICIESLSRITNPRARKELLLIAQNKNLEQTWKDLIASYLKGTNQ